ncbi:hypothetical protein Nepgr_015709 [Nepenthes gracilis]|uniref:Inositol polyphosphate-related phosphatase domain-containing protein n=1 Tax=Nepenthes gracilis TaxID=150966 RepID=A0AAD3SM80_NEPGR|nr:hypothetical protein Nepgr_015709 [Nepenthes gracilis]
MAICDILQIDKRRRNRLKRTESRLNFATNSHVMHEGVKTIETDNLCEFSDSSDLCICIITWNMGGQVVYEDLEELVGKKTKFDLLVIGLQEVPRKNISKRLQAALLQTHVLFGKAILQSLQLYLFGPKKSKSFLKELKVDKHSLGGFGGFIRRKKGAAAILVDYKGIVMVFITCHLAAHTHKVEERNSQFRLLSQLLFSKKLNPYARPAQLVVWLGDLNYRLQGIDSYPARDMIHNYVHNLLTSKDQLLQEAERGQIFDGYIEGTLSFKPTYKYNIGDNNYDTSHKVRAPAWTDRILYKIEDADKISATLNCYNSIDSIASSDHKPVKAHLCLKIKE